MRGDSIRLLQVLTVLLLFGPAAVHATCIGDCDESGSVTIEELITGVNIALGTQPLEACRAFAPQVGIPENPTVTIDLLIRAVRNALNGCPPEDTPTIAPTPTHSFAPTRTFTPTITPTASGSPEPVPPLSSSNPAAGELNVPRTAWVVLRFEGVVDSRNFGSIVLTCAESTLPATVHAIDGTTLVVNPSIDLTPGSNCTVNWPGGSVSFTTAAAGEPATVRYDRTDPRRVDPIPDDFFLVPDSRTNTGSRLQIPVPQEPQDIATLYNTVLEETNTFDGFSPIAHFVISLSDAPDVRSLPQTPTESLDPLASIGLFDLDPDSEHFGMRVPFLLKARTDTTPGRATSHTLLIFPSVPLEPGGRYGLVVTRRALVNASRPFDPSDFLRLALSTRRSRGRASTASAAERVGLLAGEVLAAVAHRAVPPIHADDVALALRFSIRSNSDIAHDLLSIKHQVLDADLPAYSIVSVQAEHNPSSPVAAYVTGEWMAPDWRTEGINFARNTDGLPRMTGSRPARFILAIPRAAVNGPVPITMYQHGNPGSAEREVPGQARRYLAEAGFAVIGFTDILNREVSAEITDPVEAITAQVTFVFFNLLQNRKIPDAWAQTNAEQIAFLRLIENLHDLDVVPVGAPDGVPDLDVRAPLTYVGISQGANHAPGLLAYAPEIRAAALIVGGSRLAETLIHQQAQLFVEQLAAFFPSANPADVWTALAFFQAMFDRQDAHNHAWFIYRQPLVIAGTTEKPSILVVEGLDDTLVPNHATESLAWAMGPIPHMQPVQRPVPFLNVVPAPVVANIDAGTTAAFFQYVPVGIPGIPPSPGCVVLSPGIATEGHYCAQSAAESLRQRVVFFQSAVNEPVPRIVDGLLEPASSLLAPASPPQEDFLEEDFLAR